MPYTINGADAAIITEPRLQDGTMWVPLRDVAQALGASVDYEPTNGVALVYSGDNVITVKVGEASVDVNGTSHALQEAPFVEDGAAWVPVRFFDKAMGASISVDLGTNGVDITSAA